MENSDFIRIKRSKRDLWTMVENYVLDDPTLSLGAKAIYCYLSSTREKYQKDDAYILENISKKDSKEYISQCLQELYDHHFILVDEEQDND